jgi:hypothetical protein
MTEIMLKYPYRVKDNDTARSGQPAGQAIEMHDCRIRPMHNRFGRIVWTVQTKWFDVELSEVLDPWACVDPTMIGLEASFCDAVLKAAQMRSNITINAMRKVK